MCLRKRKIINPVLKKNRLSISKINIDIPCGHCKECRQSRQNDWLVRSYFEFISKPQDSFFVTLDFDMQHVPLWNTLSHMPGDVNDRYRYLKEAWDYQNPPADLITCFDHKLFNRFIDSLRNGMLDHPFRYLAATDSGIYNSQPHYHVVFLFDKDNIDPLYFFQKITYYWHYGSHTNIQSIATKYKNPFKALEYVCNYSVKDTDFDKLRKRENLPARFAPRVLPSIGWGAQCMDPKEFFSDRLIKQGVMFLDRPVLTRKYLKENSRVFIDLHNDGILVPFAIPRYYELKLMYDWHWNSDLKREEAKLNYHGIELARIRTNGDYDYLYSKFLLSKNELLVDSNVASTFKLYYPYSPYNGMLWKDVVEDVSFDLDSFYEFCKVKKFLEYTMPLYSRHGKLLRQSDGIGRYRPLRLYSSKFGHYYYKAASQSQDLSDLFVFYHADQFDRYVEAMFLFDLINYQHNQEKADYYDWKAIEQAKEKARHKIAENPSLFFHLKRHNYKFSNLNSKSYVSQFKAGYD